MKIEGMKNVYGNPFLENEDYPKGEQEDIFTYKLFLVLPSVQYLLKRVVHTDIAEARRIGSYLYISEFEWLSIQPNWETIKKAGILLVFQRKHEGKEDLLVESSYESLDELTEVMRKEEKAIFKQLGKKFPKREFAGE